MSGKWKKVTDPAEIKVGDRVKVVQVFKLSGRKEITVGQVEEDWEGRCFTVSGAEIPKVGTWYIRKPKPAKPLTRPDEPPVGSFFRVGRTGEAYWRHYPFSGAAYWPFTPYTECGADNDWCHWDRITEPGDTITILELTEVGDKRDADA